MEVFMVVGYIKEEKNKNTLFSSIKMTNFDHNYSITITDQKKKNIHQKLVKKLKKWKIDCIVLSKELEGTFKEELCKRLMQERIQIVNGKKLMELMEFEIVKFVFTKQKNKMKQEDIYIVFKKEANLNLNFLKNFIENFKITNIVTNDIERLTNIQENLLQEEGILISISNNKRKALKRAKYILNINLTKEELEKYKINREAIIFNIKEEVKYDPITFNGININYFSIQCPDEILEKCEQLEGNFDMVKIYESILLNNNLQQGRLEEVYERIRKDGIKVTAVIGNNGEISEKELQKIHIENLDKIKKLV